MDRLAYGTHSATLKASPQPHAKAMCVAAPVDAQDLLKSYRNSGSPEAFAELVRRYRPMVFGVCLRVTKDVHDAEDAVQSVFLTLAVKARAEEADSIRAVGPWLRKVAHRSALDLRKSTKRRARREARHGATLPLDTPAPAHADALDLAALQPLLHEELDALPPRYRLPLILHYYGTLTADEIARELGCKPGTLSVRVHRARKVLAKRLRSRGIELSAGVLALALGQTIRVAVSRSLATTTLHALVASGSGAGFTSASAPLACGAIRVARSKLVVATVCVTLGAVATGARGMTTLAPAEWGGGAMRELVAWVQSLLRSFIPTPLAEARNDADSNRDDNTPSPDAAGSTLAQHDASATAKIVAPRNSDTTRVKPFAIANDAARRELASTANPANHGPTHQFALVQPQPSRQSPLIWTDAIQSGSNFPAPAGQWASSPPVAMTPFLSHDEMILAPQTPLTLAHAEQSPMPQIPETANGIDHTLALAAPTPSLADPATPTHLAGINSFDISPQVTAPTQTSTLPILATLPDSTNDSPWPRFTAPPSLSADPNDTGSIQFPLFTSPPSPDGSFPVDVLPEPSAALLAIGATAAMALRRRRRRYVSVNPSP